MSDATPDCRGLSRAWRRASAIALLLLLSLAGCLSVRPMRHVGVLAPFEGLHRRSGYAALEAVRSVVMDLPTTPIGWLPLAVDLSLDPLRSAQKLLVNADVAAVVGPLHPAAGFASATVLRDRPWVTPYALTATGFVDPGGALWAEALVRAVADRAAAQGATRLQIAGWDSAWPSLEGVTREGFSALPAIMYASLDALDPSDALLWLGDAADGARFIRQARARVPGLPVWVGPWLTADAVLGEHLQADATGVSSSQGPLASIVRLDAAGIAWATAHPDRPLHDYLVEGATRAALAAAGALPAAPPVDEWQPFPLIWDATGAVWRLRP